MKVPLFLVKNACGASYKHPILFMILGLGSFSTFCIDTLKFVNIRFLFMIVICYKVHS